MTSDKKSVGRPLQTDSDGNPISKTLVNLTIPVKLKDFLDKHVPNRSEFFTKVVTSLYVGAICPKCYSDNYLIKTPVGSQCTDCEVWLTLNDCPNCKESYDPRKYKGMSLNKEYNPFANDNDLKQGCSKCMEVKE